MKILDLFCGAGGAGKGYADAGFEVVGVDIDPQPSYPFELIQMDVFEYLFDYGMKARDGAFDAIHASPPCQAYSALGHSANSRDDYPDLVPRVRYGLEWFGLPYVIENVPGAPIRKDVVLCGEMFGLRVIRHRHFELGGWWMPQPAHKAHLGHVSGYRNGKYVEGRYFPVYGNGGGKGSLKDWQGAMGTPWMTSKREISQAIPPAYTKRIGDSLHGELLVRRLLAHASDGLVPA